MSFIPKGTIYTKSAVFQVMSWSESGDKPLPEPMMTKFCETI